jgi:hypothetical protein
MRFFLPEFPARTLLFDPAFEAESGKLVTRVSLPFAFFLYLSVPLHR